MSMKKMKGTQSVKRATRAEDRGGPACGQREFLEKRIETRAEEKH